MRDQATSSTALLGALLGALALASSSACSDDGSSADELGSETGDPTTSGDGDGDPTTTTTGDGDGDPATGDGDGDGDPSTGDGDGDGGWCEDGVVPNLAFEAAYDEIEHGWVRAERWSIESPAIPEDPFFPDARSEQSDQQLTFFGSDPTPGPEQVVIQFGPGWDTNQRTPVVLVHGADDPPDRAWAFPGVAGPYGCGAAECPDEGLMQALAAADIPVFAITFPHKQGDNYMWAEQIHAAIQVVRELTCADEVDLIAWSKGTVAARMYASSLTEDWGTPYQDDVRKLILIGGPNLGMDYAFRYGSGPNATVWPPGMLHGPTPHHEQLIGIQVVDRSEYAIYETAGGYYYRGQAQMLARWDEVYDLVYMANNGLGPYATVDTLSTYYGEDMYAGTLARGYGIQYAIDQSSVIDALVDAGIPASVETYLLCSEVGGQEDYMVGIPNEISGPSDGVVFVQSCAAPDGIGTIGGIEVLQGLNHLELGWAPPARQAVLGWLAE